MDAEFSLRDYLVILRRRILYLIVPFCIIFPIGAAVAILMPPLYQSTGTILVESQQIPSDLVRSTITSFADERIQFIQQKVMTRQTMLDVIEKYGVFQGKNQPDSLSDMVEEMRQRVSVATVNAEMRRGRGQDQAAIAFTISYADPNADRALAVTNEFVTLFLNENVKTRTERASETTNFLGDEAERLRKDLEARELEIATYKQENSTALPEHLSLHLGMLERAEQDLEKTNRDIATLEQELRFLKVELVSAGSTVLSPAQELLSLRNRLVELQALYGDSHPDVRAVQRRVEAFEKKIADAGAAAEHGEEGGAPDGALGAADPLTARVEAQIESLTAQRGKLNARIGNLEARIAQTPQVERGLAALERGYENLLAKYEEVKGNQLEAQMAENLEGDQKAERFILLEPPLKPERPTSPNRPKIIVLSFFLAIAGGAGGVMAAEAFNGGITSAGQIAQKLRQAPIAVIPYIVTEAERRQRRKILRGIAFATPVLLVVALSSIHFFYMPLDIVLHKIVTRF